MMRHLRAFRNLLWGGRRDVRRPGNARPALELLEGRCLPSATFLTYSPTDPLPGQPAPLVNVVLMSDPPAPAPAGPFVSPQTVAVQAALTNLLNIEFQSFAFNSASPHGDMATALAQYEAAVTQSDHLLPSG
jgi:hypothetical protein